MENEKDLKKYNLRWFYIITFIQALIYTVILVFIYESSHNIATILIVGVILFLILIIFNWILYKCSLILSVPFWVLWLISFFTGGLGTIFILIYTLVVYSQDSRERLKKSTKKKIH